jgi:hypothetical protein
LKLRHTSAPSPALRLRAAAALAQAQARTAAGPAAAAAALEQTLLAEVPPSPTCLVSWAGAARIAIALAARAADDDSARATGAAVTATRLVEAWCQGAGDVVYADSRARAAGRELWVAAIAYATAPLDAPGSENVALVPGSHTAALCLGRHAEVAAAVASRDDGAAGTIDMLLDDAGLLLSSRNTARLAAAAAIRALNSDSPGTRGVPVAEHATVPVSAAAATSATSVGAVVSSEGEGSNGVVDRRAGQSRGIRATVARVIEAMRSSSGTTSGAVFLLCAGLVLQLVLWLFRRRTSAPARPALSW